MTEGGAHTSEFDQKIIALCQRLCGKTHALDALRRLTGGANMESWRIDYGPHSWVMRRVPPGIEQSASDIESKIDVDAEAAVIAAAIRKGVTAPHIVGSLVEADDLGSGFVMLRIDGETLPHKILANPDYAKALQNLTRQCAEQLAKIHAVPLAELPSHLPNASPAEMVEALATRYAESGAHIPVFDLALHWLANNLPTPRAPVLVHGDFRMGNLMINDHGIAAVLDWEVAHIGDAAHDLAYLCMPSWRFGHYDRLVGGFGQLDDLLASYKEMSGIDIAVADITFWMILSSLGWGMGTLLFAQLWRSGQDKTLERAVVGRRTSETEIDLLLMLEDRFDFAQPQLNWSLPDIKAPQGETAAAELIEALILWDEESVMPNAAERDLFQARVARNALRILSRAALYGNDFAQHKAERLSKLGLTQIELCSKLRSGRFDENILEHLRLDLLERLHIDQPKYAGYHQALKKWTGQSGCA
jgi:aminoglycoside phosphotransferase (APT) family kinase protein